MLILNSRLSNASPVRAWIHLANSTSRVVPRRFNSASRASSEPSFALAATSRFSAAALPAALSAAVALASRSLILISCSRTCRSTWMVCSGLTARPSAATCDLTGMTSLSNWLRRISTPLPLARIVSPGGVEAWAADAALVCAGCAAGARPDASTATATKRTNGFRVIFIYKFRYAARACSEYLG